MSSHLMNKGWLVLCTLPAILGGCPRDDGFENHLNEAIELYEARKVEYAAMTNGQSDRLFDLLMSTEKAIKPVARVIDWRATPFIERGIPVVENDFVPMDTARDTHDPVEPAMEFPDELKDEVRELMDSFHDIPKDDFENVAAKCYAALQTVSELETYYHVHLPMVRHVIESIGLAALHAIDYSAMSGGQTDDLSRDFVSTQILGLNELIITFEGLANSCHQQGVGVLVNDLPGIPFVEEYEQSTLFCASSTAPPEY